MRQIRIIKTEGQDRCTHLTTFCDTEHAVCVRTRKSTKREAVAEGKALIQSICNVLFLIALFSGEAEYYGLISAVSESLGEQSLAAMRSGIRILMDAIAWAAIGSRRGFGRVKHLSRARLGKVHSSENLADMLTKPGSGQSISDELEHLGFRASLHYDGLSLEAIER